MSATPLLRRLPPDASVEDIARAYADALLFVLQTMPARLEELTATSDKMQAVCAVSDAAAQRAANAAARLEAIAQRLEGEAATLRADVERLMLAQGRADGQLRAIEMRQQRSSEDIERKVEEIEEEVQTGRHNIPSVRVREVLKSVSNETELEKRRLREKWQFDIVKGVLTALGTAGVFEVIRLIVTHHP